MAEFKASLGRSTAPGLDPPLAALVGRQRRLGPAHRIVQDERARGGLGSCLSAPGRGRPGNAGYWYRQAGKPVAPVRSRPNGRRSPRPAREQAHEAANAKLIKGATGDWEVVIGLEVHAQVTSKSKLFSGASTEFGGEPNSHVSLVDAAMPGMLPVINEECVAPGGAHRARPQRADQPALGVRPQELFLSRPAAGLPDQPVQVADRRRGRGRGRLAGGETASRSASSGCIWSRTPASCCTTSSPTMSFVDLNRSGVALMEIVSKPDMRSSEQAQGLCDQAALDPALSRHLRRRHGEGQPARRRQRLGAQAGRAARHPLRDQERQLDPLHRPGDRVRGAPPDRNHRGRRHDRAGDPAVRRRARARPARCAPRKRRTTTAISPIPTCCRWSSAQAYVDELKAEPAGAAGREEGALHRGLRAVAL